MEVSNSYSGLMKKETDNACLNFQDKALSSYIYIKNYQQINLEKKELAKEFISGVLDHDSIIALSDIYLSVLKTSEHEKYEGLKHGDGFDLDEVVTSLSKDLTDDYQKYGIILYLLDQKNEKEYPDTNPLKTILDKEYFQDFFNGLELSYSERVLFVLAIANEVWGWLFPEYKNDEYKAHLFCHICEINKKDELAYSRKINSLLIQLGLFSAPWKISSYVYTYFMNESPAFICWRVVPPKCCDIYDYKETGRLNQKELEIMRKLKGFMVICSDSDYRNEYFLADYYHDCFDGIYEFTKMYKGTSKAEMEFYIYVLSLEINHHALFINKDLCKLLLQEESENPFAEILHKNQGSSSILEKVKCPVILSMESFTEEDREHFLENGIDVLYTLQLKLPEKKNYAECFGVFYLQEELPVNLLVDVALECDSLAIPPDQWSAVSKLLKSVQKLTKEEALELLRNRFSNGGKNDKLRKNSHYCVDALNTTEPINEVTNALKNADEYQKGEYDEESGIKVLLYGISGGGKTAYAEEVSKKMNKPLKIVRPSEVLSKWVGETEQNISRLFKEAAKEHSILLVDEADSFLHNRGDSVNHFEDSKVNSFLIEIERYPGILFCSTNLPDILDKAVDRRFNFKIGFKALTKDGVSLLCKSYFSSFELDDAQVMKIYNSGEVTPGDFATLNGKLRFLAPEKRNSVYITEELCKIVRDKKRSYESNKIGFGN